VLDGFAIDHQAEPFLEREAVMSGWRHCSSTARAMPVRPSASKRSWVG
jgi:hypothetical protein